MPKALLFLLLCVPFLLFSQEEAPQLSKEEKKAQRKEDKITSLDSLHQMLQDRAYVLEANTLSVLDQSPRKDRFFELEGSTLNVRNGGPKMVSKTLNFLGVNGEQTVLQLSFAGSLPQTVTNGITLIGTVQTYEIDRSSPDSFIKLRLIYSGRTTGFVNVFMTVSADGMAQAQISGLVGERVTMYGQLVPLASSTVFQRVSNVR